VVRHGPVDSLDEAAELRGVTPSAVIKTMVVRRDEDSYVFVLVPGDRVIDWALLRAELGQRRLSMPDADEALRVTGYVRGTITPFGASTEWPVFADTGVSEGAVSVCGGAPGVSVTIEGKALLAALDATIANITKQRS
jgi:Cys-tRNA(Pro)/Cys-tRNA(Cys) deacylase